MMLQGALASPPPPSLTLPAPQEEDDDGVEWKKQGGGGTGVHPSSVVPWLVGRTAEGACVCPCICVCCISTRDLEQAHSRAAHTHGL